MNTWVIRFLKKKTNRMLSGKKTEDKLESLLYKAIVSLSVGEGQVWQVP